MNVADPGANQDAATKKYHDDNKYTDAEAVAAADASDKFIERNVENAITAVTTLKSTSASAFLNFKLVQAGLIFGGIPMELFLETTGFTYNQSMASVFFPRVNIKGTDAQHAIGDFYFEKPLNVNYTYIRMRVADASANLKEVLFLTKDYVSVKGLPIKDIKNHADATLSGTPKIIELLIGSTPYYFKVYPTKT